MSGTCYNWFVCQRLPSTRLRVNEGMGLAAILNSIRYYNVNYMHQTS